MTFPSKEGRGQKGALFLGPMGLWKQVPQEDIRSATLGACCGACHAWQAVGSSASQSWQVKTKCCSFLATT